LITVEARVVVASIDTYLKYAEAVGQVSTVSRPAIEATTQDLAAENVALRAELAERDRAARKRRRAEASERG
jgi:hypothetical protein